MACVVAAVAIAAVWSWRAQVQRDDGRGLLGDDGKVARAIDCDPCRGPRSWSGTWFLPRGGPYLFFLETLDGSSGTLAIDGEQILAGTPRRETRDRKGRMHVVRRVYAAGAHAVTVTHAGEGRFALYWLPPGRRGDPETVPPEALRPVPPERAGERPEDLTYPEEAVAFTTTALVLLGLALFLARRRLAAVRREDLLWGAGIFVAAAALRLTNLSAFGQTWDEDVYWSSGRNYLLNLASLDFRPRMWTWNFEHPPVAKYLLGLGALWHDGYEPARAVIALLSSGIAVVAYLLGRDLYSGRAGAAAGLLVAFAPHVAAHGVISGLETPSTFFATLAAWLFLRRSHVLAGVAGGLASGSRFIAALVFFAMAASALLELAASRRDAADRRFTTLREWAHLALAPLAGFVTLVAVWPRLWLEGPFVGLNASYHKLNVQHTAEWFWGVQILTPVPKSYFFAYFAAGMVPAVLVGLLFCAIFRPGRSTLRLLPFLLAPFGMMFSPVIQSGLRYLLPAIPIACVLAAAGLEAAALRVHARAVWPTLGAAVLSSLISCLLVWPYHLDYYNVLFGGPRAALREKRFVFGWWGEGIQAAVDHVNRAAPRGARVFYDLFPNHIVWLRDDFKFVTDIKQADWVLLNRYQFRRAETAPKGFREVFSEEVRGAPLVKVFVKAE